MNRGWRDLRKTLDHGAVSGTIVIGCGFAAKYPEGGGNFSVPLQYALGLRRMRRRFLWFEVMPSTGDVAKDARVARTFRRRLDAFGLGDSFALMIFDAKIGMGELSRARFFGRGRRDIENLLGGETVLLNLSYSIRPPLVDKFSFRKLCSLDPTEVCFWMQRMEMGQSHHDEFWTIGLNTGAVDSRVPDAGVAWRTFFPLVDTESFDPLPRPPRDVFSTIGQWYWDGMIEFEGEWRDFSKKAAFEKFLPLARLVPEADFELAMNLPSGDSEAERLAGLGWKPVVPHVIARTPARYYGYLGRSTAEFSAVKLESWMRSGWLSDRSAVYLALGRPVITESTGAERYLPGSKGLLFADTLEAAREAVRRVLKDWKSESLSARQCAVECFDAARNLRKMLA